MIKKLLVIFLVIFLASCSNDGQEDTNTKSDESQNAEPIISISEIDDLIEKKTSFRVTISGVEEQTNSTLLINDMEVISTNQKDFEFELNPFDYPNGQTFLTVKSATSNNKESIKNEEFEIKKLLFKSYGGLSSESVDSYLAINLQSTGELVAFKKIITYDDPIFFHAEDNFIEEDIIVTQYILSKSTGFNVATMYGNVKPGTELISSYEIREILGLDQKQIRKESSFNLTIEGANYYGLFNLLGKSYSFGTVSVPTFEIVYDEEQTEDVFLYHFLQSNENTFDNYRYAYLENLNDQTLQFDKMSTVSSEFQRTINLPQDVIKANITLLGHSNVNDYRESNSKLLFGYGIETELEGYSIHYPDLQEYPVILKGINLGFTDGVRITFVQRGEPDITVPNLTIQENDGFININGEYDYSDLTTEIKHPDPENNTVFLMSYKNLSSDLIEIPFENFEIPEEIVQFLNESGLDVSEVNNFSGMRLRIYEFENNGFPNGAFYIPSNGVGGDSVTWYFPLQD